tara:strand:- start:1220 stop:1912 length:693 start_codon:yes stop_codon:yes gene_type:complete
MSKIEVLAFDIFGTVVDWHSSICKEIKQNFPDIDSSKFANAWRAGYKPGIQEVSSGKIKWITVDQIHKNILGQILREFKIDINERKKNDINHIWHRLKPWPDSILGMKALRKKFKIVTLSNGNFSLLSNLSKNAGLQWDLILSAEMFRSYKPSPNTYLGVADIFSLEPHKVMMVATHEDDLMGAKSCGLKTAYVHRKDEYGLQITKNINDLSRFDIVSNDLMDLASKLSY